MSTMVCSRCHKFGIYWRNLGGFNEHTYCPHCNGINCQAIEYEDMTDEEHTND